MPEEKTTNWANLAPIIAETLLPLIEKLWIALASKNLPTQEQWDALRVDAHQLARARMLKMLLDNGIDPSSEQGKAFLDLTTKA